MLDAIFFDLDGTLTDPKPGITRCIRHALERLDITAPSEDELTWCIGPPLRASLAKMVGEGAADQALAFYHERFSSVGLYENDLYPGIRDMLESLKGKRLFVATSKPWVYAKPILSHFGIDGFFEGVFGSELDGTRADKSELLAHALRQSGATAPCAVMVGDRSHDMIGARRNSIAGLGVSYGYGGEAELREAGAIDVFPSVELLCQNLLLRR